jgi:predicted glycoside hydrolase/deacetylase ChbG (UPF0249 family)
MKHIIITADDFGMCEDVDIAILDCIKIGTVTSTNVLVNMSSLSKAKELLNYHVSIGIHWNITAGKSVLSKKDIPTLVDDDGNFYDIKELKRRVKNKKIDCSDIKNELIAQYKKFVEVFGIKPAYWNTHQNSSLITELIPFFFKAGKEIGIKTTRNFVRCYGDFRQSSFKRRLRELIVRIGVNYYFNFLAKKYYIMADARYFSFNSYAKLDLKKLCECLSSCEFETIELVCHPATSDSCPYFGSISDLRVKEYDFFFKNGELLKHSFSNNGLSIETFDVLKELDNEKIQRYY